ncbi:MAG: hypothetical protein GWN00_20355 [Aliifodinibius sp.]|nr:hypothetical protein [candidate division Zixibacteria bacterium]NIT58491.1 hypothetical protein [Fodinibius sp.]NIW46206.1 hypothetical protein [Gammaproteobacteria bacterium]NIR65173.1 hypothetical protein [candidate division Zixibacteria bacterium]NIS46905.1 hypothetical protein [candidate division Zixibacteria bacterium]
MNDVNDLDTHTRLLTKCLDLSLLIAEEDCDEDEDVVIAIRELIDVLEEYDLCVAWHEKLRSTLIDSGMDPEDPRLQFN